MRLANVFHNGRYAGDLRQLDDRSFEFVYSSTYLADPSSPPISLTLPKQNVAHQSKTLFPAFWQLLPEGHNKRVLCQTLRIDPSDAYSILLRVAGKDTVGAITVKAASDGGTH